MTKTMRSAAALLLVCALGMPRAPLMAGEVESRTEWMALFLAGAKSGHARMDRTVSDEKVTTKVTMNMEMKRAGMSVKIKAIETFRETTGGKPLGFTSEMQASIMTQKKSGVIKDGKLHITIETGGMQQQKVIDWPEEALMSEGMRQLGLKKGLKEGTKYSVKTFDSSAMAFMDTAIEIGVVRLTEVKSTASMGGAEIKSTTYVNKNQDALKMSLSMMGVALEMVSCTKQFALSPNEPSEFFTKMLVKAPRAFSKAELSKPITYTLTPIDKTKNLNLVNSDEQKASEAKLGAPVTVNVKPLAPKASEAFPYTGKDEAALEALKPTGFVQSDAKEIIALAKQAVGEIKDAAEAVKRIETFISTYINNKNLSVGYASALEVAQSKEGDCTEHAVLAAALCRAQGIPARVATGLAYIPQFAGQNNIFGPHAWFQAYIGGQWISFDAALKGFDAGHILLGHGDGQPANFFDMVNVLGNIEVTKAVAGE